MAAAGRRPPPLYVLHHYLLVGNGHAGKGGEGWANPNLRTSTLGLRVTRDALTRFNSELGFAAAAALDVDDDEEEKEAMLATAIMKMQEQGLLIIALLLERRLRRLSCYLVYDRGDASLSMVSWVPKSLKVFAMFKPVPKPTSDGGGAYQLFLLACDERDGGRMTLQASDTDPQPSLCVSSPVTVTGTTNSRTFAWEMRRTLGWNVPDSVWKRFHADTTFSFQGKGFWADLTQALIYCDLPTGAGDAAAAVVDFGCIELPGECQLELEEMVDNTLPMEVTTTIACVGDSIWFVCIRRGKHHADDSVTVWSLGLPGSGQWKNEARFHVREFWTFDGFKEAGLPEARVGYPVITADAAVGLVVAGKIYRHSYADASSVDHICTFDVGSKKILWHGTVRDHIFTQTVALPPDFFVQRKHGSRKRKLDELHPAAGPGFAAGE